MANGSDKYRSRRNRTRIRELFCKERDPIGVNGCEGAEDEYDRYADHAYVMLMEGRSEAEIADYLYHISSEYMGLGQSQAGRELAAKIADKLCEWLPSLLTESDVPF
jgi:hypothetical protein